MPNPHKPTELKILQGNPGKKALRLNDAIAPMDYGYIEPLRELGEVGKQFWDNIFDAGEIWISIRTDTELVQMVCEQLDRREQIKQQIASDPTDPTWYRQMNEIEKQIVSSFSLLGFTPADRTRLGLVSAKTKSKLEELLAKKAKRDI
jgi:P27 family predicted phage terminase small subunit